MKFFDGALSLTREMHGCDLKQDPCGADRTGLRAESLFGSTLRKTGRRGVCVKAAVRRQLKAVKNSF